MIAPWLAGCRDLETVSGGCDVLPPGAVRIRGRAGLPRACR